MAEPTQDAQPVGMTSEELARLLASAGVTEVNLGGGEEADKKPKVKDRYAGGNAVSGAARSLGQGVLLGFADEAMAALRSATGKETYAEAVKDEREKLKAFRKAHPVISFGAEMAGGFATPGLGLATGLLRPAATGLGRMAQGATIGSGLGAVAGAGAGDEDRWAGAKQGAGLGLLVGAAAPMAGQAIAAGANRVTDPDVAGADHALIRDLRDAGYTPARVRQFFAEADEAARVHSTGQPADLPLMLADHPALQRTAGSAVRASRETGNRAEAVFGARQTGITPDDARMAQMADEGGITHRNPLAPLDPEARLRAPAGQHERFIHSNLRKTYQLIDKQHSGFADNAYQTEQTLVKALKEASDKNYGAARTAFQGYDFTNDIENYMAALAKSADDLPLNQARLVRNFARQFTTGNGGWVNTLDGLDNAKRQVDRIIEKMINAGDKTGVRQMTDLKNAFLAKIDDIKDGNGVEIGKLYQKARNFHYTESQKQNAIEWGRNAVRGESNATAEEFAAFDPALKKFARLGILEGLERMSMDKRRANDITQIFQTNRMQSLMRETIERSDNAGAVFANRPERFGRQTGYEQRMVSTSNKVLGNSKTAERLSDDDRLKRQTLSTMFERFRSGNLGAVPMVMEAVSAGLNRFFGMNEGVAREIGRRLLTARRDEIDRIIARLEARWGVDRVGAFTRYLEGTTLGSAATLPPSVARTAAENRERNNAQGLGLLPAR
jgi:hypothetical protein